MKVLINRLKWEIKEVENDDEMLKMKNGDATCGVEHYGSLTIRIAKSMPDGVKRHSLFHEVVHATIDSYGFLNKDKWTEEQVCEFVATQIENIMEIVDKYFQQ